MLRAQRDRARQRGVVRGALRAGIGAGGLHVHRCAAGQGLGEEALLVRDQHLPPIRLHHDRLPGDVLRAARDEDVGRTFRRRARPVGFDVHPGEARAERSEQRRVGLQQRLAAGQHAAEVRASGDQRVEPGQDRVERQPFTAAEIGVAVRAGAFRPRFRAAIPGIAAGQAQEHARPAGVRAFALERGAEGFLDRVDHLLTR